MAIRFENRHWMARSRLLKYCGKVYTPNLQVEVGCGQVMPEEYLPMTRKLPYKTVTFPDTDHLDTRFFVTYRHRGFMQ